MFPQFNTDAINFTSDPNLSLNALQFVMWCQIYSQNPNLDRNPFQNFEINNACQMEGQALNNENLNEMGCKLFHNPFVNFEANVNSKQKKEKSLTENVSDRSLFQ